jgi:hypothetical protein
MLDNISKMTKENVEAFVTGLQNGDTQRQISESIGISEATLSLWKRRALADEPLSGNDLLLQPLRDFFGRKDEELGHREMRAALVKAVTTDSVTTIEKVTEIVKLTSSQRETLGEDLSSAFDAGDVVLVQKVTTTKTESPDPTVVTKAYQILFSEDDDSTGDEDSGRVTSP